MSVSEELALTFFIEIKCLVSMLGSFGSRTGVAILLSVSFEPITGSLTGLIDDLNGFFRLILLLRLCSSFTAALRC